MSNHVLNELDGLLKTVPPNRRQALRRVLGAVGALALLPRTTLLALEQRGDGGQGKGGGGGKGNWPGDGTGKGKGRGKGGRPGDGSGKGRGRGKGTQPDD